VGVLSLGAGLIGGKKDLAAHWALWRRRPQKAASKFAARSGGW